MGLIPRKQLEDLGFAEVKDRLFLKEIGELKLWRDYRNHAPLSYAYHKEERLKRKNFKEFEAIDKIERIMRGELTLFFNVNQIGRKAYT